MFDLDKWQEIYTTLAKNKLRTFLTALGVLWGIFMLVVMMGSGKGLQNGVYTDFSGTATNSFFLWTRSTTMPYKGLPPGRSFNMDNADYFAIRNEIKEADVIAPRNQLGGYRGGNNVTRGINTGNFAIMGDYPQIAGIEGIKILQGRFLNTYDLEENRKVTVIGVQVLNMLFEPGEDPIGAYIRANGVYFKVIGVFDTQRSGDRAEQETQRLYVPFTTFQQTFNYGDRIGWFAISSQPQYTASLVEEKVIDLLKARHRIHPDDDRAFGHWNMEKEFSQIQALFNGITFFIWVVGIGTLLAGVIGVSNIMLIVVKERTKEFGIRRALGATPISIISQVILEAVILTSLAGYFGLVIGIGFNEAIIWGMDTFGIQAEMYKNPGVDLSVAVKALIILVVSGALAGLLPAIRAVSVRPVEALRAE